jgi:hypothetical protein
LDNTVNISHVKGVNTKELMVIYLAPISKPFHRICMERNTIKVVGTKVGWVPDVLPSQNRAVLK